jgi:hypothetical protein
LLLRCEFAAVAEDIEDVYFHISNIKSAIPEI